MINNRRLSIYAIAAVAVLILLFNTFYVVEQREQALVLRLGEPVRVVNQPGSPNAGLKMKVPFLENVVKLDKRNLPLEAQQEEIIAADQERLVVDAFVRYRIDDPLQYFRTLREERIANDRIERLVNSSLRQVLGTATSTDIISGRRGELMQRILQDVSNRAESSRLGIQIIDVRIKRADLPQANQAAVFRRMQTSRQQEAAQIRAQGEQRKREIIASADKEVSITLATATEEAERTRGEGDAQRTRIFADSFGRDPGFASFYRSMQAYEAAFAQGDTTMVLSPDSQFFRYFERGPGG
ncbi:MAG: protease modulator HflC [Phenylobacterium sp.]|jgi:membrane protease subunit HflC|uniref:protease modulator HflC n=1 Tax=Phenylobacterium sp. TaxID=1871053 RepID=UPI002A30CADE|nr:protease modulator HflC [Phenylobacterium sp.]MDD3836548.1 protease modulator HflC [Phenylobacterium sp.]MDX9997733.1 protease modulator HflC [Phenylobacterium sp.]